GVNNDESRDTIQQVERLKQHIDGKQHTDSRHHLSRKHPKQSVLSLLRREEAHFVGCRDRYKEADNRRAERDNDRVQRIGEIIAARKYITERFQRGHEDDIWRVSAFFGLERRDSHPEDRKKDRQRNQPCENSPQPFVRFFHASGLLSNFAPSVAP